MRPFGEQPRRDELEKFLTDEERTLIGRPKVPDDEKAEIADRLEAFAEADLETEIGDEPVPRPRKI